MKNYANKPKLVLSRAWGILQKKMVRFFFLIKVFVSFLGQQMTYFFRMFQKYKAVLRKFFLCAAYAAATSRVCTATTAALFHLVLHRIFVLYTGAKKCSGRRLPLCHDHIFLHRSTMCERIRYWGGVTGRSPPHVGGPTAGKNIPALRTWVCQKCLFSLHCWAYFLCLGVIPHKKNSRNSVYQILVRTIWFFFKKEQNVLEIQVIFGFIFQQ